MLIGSKQHGAGNSTRYEVEYCYWLEPGRTLQNAGFSAVLVDAPADVAISAVSVTAHRLYFMIIGGSVNETFTVQVQVTDTLNEVVVDTINFSVLAP